MNEEPSTRWRHHYDRQRELELALRQETKRDDWARSAVADAVAKELTARTGLGTFAVTVGDNWVRVWFLRQSNNRESEDFVLLVGDGCTPSRSWAKGAVRALEGVGVDVDREAVA